MSFEGLIIEESLSNKTVLENITIVSTKVEPVTEHHKTPWLKQWTLHTVVIEDQDSDQVADELSKSLEDNYWYADFKNDQTHYIIFPNKVFKIDRTKESEYMEATKHGLSLGIPKHQLDFSPNVVDWKRET